MKKLILLLCCITSLSIYAQDTTHTNRLDFPLKFRQQSRFRTYNFGEQGACLVSIKYLEAATVSRIQVKLMDTNLNIIKDTTFFGPDEKGQYERAYLIEETSTHDAAYIFCGVKKSSSQSDYYIFKISANGTITKTSVELPWKKPIYRLRPFFVNNDHLHFIITKKEEDFKKTHLFYSINVKTSEVKTTDITYYNGIELENPTILANNANNFFLLVGTLGNQEEIKVISRKINNLGEIDDSLTWAFSNTFCVRDLKLEGNEDSFVIAGSLDEKCKKYVFTANYSFIVGFNGNKKIFYTLLTEEEKESQKQNPILKVEDKYYISFNRYYNYDNTLVIYKTIIHEVNNKGELLNEYNIYHEHRNQNKPNISCQGKVVYLSKTDDYLVTSPLNHRITENTVFYLSKIENGELVDTNKTYTVNNLPKTVDTRTGGLLMVHWYSNYYLIMGNEVGKKLVTNPKNNKTKKSKYKHFYIEKIDIRTIENRAVSIPEE